MSQLHHGEPARRLAWRPPDLALRDLSRDSICVALLFLGLVAIYHGMFAFHAADDTFFEFTPDGTYSLALANYVNGRFLPGLVFQAVAATGRDIFDYWTAVQVLAFGAISILSYVFIYCLNLRLSRVEMLILASIIILIPYNANLLINKNNAVNATIAFTSVTASIYAYYKLNGILRVLFPSIFLFLSISSYQTTFYYFIVFNISYYLFNGSTRRETCRGIAQGIAACVLAVGGYLLVYKLAISWALLEITRLPNPDVALYYGNPRSGLSNLAGQLTSAMLFIFSIGRVLLAPEPIFSLPLKIFGVATFLIAYHFWANASLENPSPEDQPLFVLRKRRLMILALILAIGSPIHLLLANNWLAPRIYAHAGAIWAVFFATALVFGQPSRRRIYLVCCAVFSLGLAISTFRVTTDIEILYHRDIKIAHDIVEDFKSRPDFRTHKPLAIVGIIPYDSAQSASIFKYFYIAVSKFTERWSRFGFLEQATGEKFKRPTPAFAAMARDRCRTLTVRHDLYQVDVTPEGSVLCLQTSWSSSTNTSAN